MANPGSITNAVPDPDRAIRALRDQERTAQENAAARSLAASQIGNGGTLKIDGSLVVSGTFSVPGGISSGGTLSAATTISAGTTITAGTTLNSTGNTNVGADISVTGYVYTPAGYAYDITYTRHGAWLGNDGRLGWASSSRDGKTNFANPDIDPAAVLKIASTLYNYKAEIEKQANDPTYHVAVEWGAIAEDLHALGLWQVVVYEWTLEYQLAPVLDANGLEITNDAGEVLKERIGSGKRIGEPRPIGIHYELLGLLAIEAAKHLAVRVEALEKRLDDQGL